MYIVIMCLSEIDLCILNPHTLLFNNVQVRFSEEI